MVSSSRKMIVRLLLLLTAIVSANAQPAANKGSTSTVSGKVTMAGKGVAEMVVGLSVETPSSSINITRLIAVTDEEGNYKIKNVPAGTYQVLISTSQFVQSERAPVIVGKNEVIENVDITLLRGGVITGKITDADGRPVVEEPVLFSSIGPSRGLPYLRAVRTDDRGVYRAFAIPPGRYTVAAGRDSLSSFGRTEAGPQRTFYPNAVNPAEATPIQVNEGSESTNVDIRLARQLGRYAVHGRIIDGDTSQPLPNARIGMQLFFAVGGSTSRDPAGESTKDGVFKIENLAPGKYAVYFDSAADSERFSEAVRFEVTDQDIDGLLIKTSKGASVSGVVVVEGTHDPNNKPNLAGDRIFVFPSNESYGQRAPTTNINPDGSFHLSGLPAGPLRIGLPQRRDRLQLMRIERDGFVYRNSIDVKEREQITGLRVIVSEANGTIRGVLKLPEGVQLPAMARLLVSVRRVESPTAYNSPAEADARGQFRIQNLVPGTYEFSVGVVGVPADQRPRIPRPVETVVVTNGAIADVTITLQMPKTGPSGP